MAKFIELIDANSNKKILMNADRFSAIFSTMLKDQDGNEFEGSAINFDYEGHMLVRNTYAEIKQMIEGPAKKSKTKE